MSVSPSQVFSEPRVVELATAAEEGDVETIKSLVNQGVPLNAQGDRGITPIWFAMGHRRHRAFEAMLQLGADPNLIGNRTSILQMAVIHPDPFYLESALKFRGDPNLRDPIEHNTMLEIALSYERNDRVEMLVRAGMKLDQFSHGEYPLTCAAQLIQYDVVLVLLRAGADPRIKNSTGSDLATIMRASKRNPNFAPSSAFKETEEVLKAKFGIDVSAVSDATG